jgi:predicted amidohydrolase
MTRVELYHKPKHFKRNGKLIVLICLAIAAGMFAIKYYYQSTIRIDSQGENLGKKVIVHLPNGDDVFTYDKLIVEKDGKTYYKGEWNKIDLTGGTIDYKNWK